MKKIILLSAALLLLLGPASFALAGDSAVIPISITIPAIPGVNAPPYTASAPQVNHALIVEQQGQTQTVYSR